MTLFWVICALLVVIALAFVLPILQSSDEPQVESDEERKLSNIAVYRDQLSELEADLRNGIVSQEQYTQDRDEIDRRLLEDTAKSISKTKGKAPANARSTAYLLGFGIPIVAAVFYSYVGNPKMITNPNAASLPSSETPAGPFSGSAPRSQEQIEANVARLAQRLESNPNDAAGWTMLARSYSSMEKYDDAAKAYVKATELSPNDADLLAEYAFATAMAEGRNLQGRPLEIINQALKVDPENAKALQLAGSAAFQAEDYKKAIEYWERVARRVPPDSEVGQTIQERINEAKSLAAGK